MSGELVVSADLVEISVGKMVKANKNYNVDVCDRAGNNRVLHLFPHKKYAQLLADRQKEMHESVQDMLKTVLQEVKWLRCLAFGNVDLAQTKELCKLVVSQLNLPFEPKQMVGQKVTKITERVEWKYLIE